MPLEHRGFSVHISCDGKEIPHHRSEVLNETQISCWISSEAGKEFVVHHDGTGNAFSYIADLYCDGRFMCGYAQEAGWKSTISEVRTSMNTTKRILFSNVKVHEDDDYSDLSQGVDITRLGVVEVRIFHAIPKNDLKPPIVNTVDDLGPVPELSKKGGLHQVSLGKSSTVDAKPVRHWHCVEPENKPYASFLFYHRPAGLLQAMGIMPRPPPVETEESTQREGSQGTATTSSKRRKHGDGGVQVRKRSRLSNGPSGSGSEDDVKPDIEDEDIDELEENIRRMQEKLQKRKKAKKGISGRVKTERAPSPILVGSAAGTVIDLTDD